MKLTTGTSRISTLLYESSSIVESPVTSTRTIHHRFFYESVADFSRSFHEPFTTPFSPFLAQRYVVLSQTLSIDAQNCLLDGSRARDHKSKNNTRQHHEVAQQAARMCCHMLCVLRHGMPCQAALGRRPGCSHAHPITRFPSVHPGIGAVFRGWAWLALRGHPLSSAAGAEQQTPANTSFMPVGTITDTHFSFPLLFLLLYLSTPGNPYLGSSLMQMNKTDQD